jgi:ketosteroid isomerase-like protein
LAAVTARDTVRIGTFYVTEAVGSYPNQPIARGVTAIVHSYAGLLAMPAIKMTAVPTMVTVSKSGDLATSTGTYHLTYNGQQGPVADSGSYIEVFRKVNGQWRIANEIVTSSAPMVAMAPMTMAADAGTMAAVNEKAVTWQPLDVKGFAPGAKMAVIHGDPANGNYVLRLDLPAGYRFPVHWHPGTENVTVLEGTLLLGMGNTANTSAEKAYKEGDYLYIPGRNPHFGGAKGHTIIQLHGTGPFAINLGAP